MKLSVSEQRLLDFAREQFGEHLSQFLLAGLGEEQVGQRGRFTITYASGENVALKRHVEVITYEPEDGSSSLPCGRNPLVLIALLHLLMTSNQGALNMLRYEQEQVLSLLGWKETRKARQEIDEAVKRYFLLTYQWKMNKSELQRERLTLYTVNEALISAHESISTEDGKLSRIVFNEHFIEHLLSRSLFGIYWNSVRSVVLKVSPKK
jgi:hypothetical protein